MSSWQAFILGVLQGATEFLPVSSSGHIVLVPWLLGWPEVSLSFGAAVHLGTLLAVLVFLRRELWMLISGLGEALLTRKLNRVSRIVLLMLVATLPGALAGLVFEDAAQAAFGLPKASALLLAVTGVILHLSGGAKRGWLTLEDLGYKRALAIGVAQAVAVAPGLSRSGLTIAAGLAVGLAPTAAVQFSFLLSVPIIAGAGAFELAKLAVGPRELALALKASCAAAVVGFLSMRALLRVVQRTGLRPFSYYCWFVGALCFALSLARG